MTPPTADINFYQQTVVERFGGVGKTLMVRQNLEPEHLKVRLTQFYYVSRILALNSYFGNPSIDCFKIKGAPTRLDHC